MADFNRVAFFHDFPKAGRDLCERALLRLSQSGFRRSFSTIFRSYLALGILRHIFLQ